MDVPISISEFKKLSLERRTKMVLRDYFYDEVSVVSDRDGINSITAKPFLEAWAYAEKKKYIELAGGTPKSGPRYGYTKEGLDFMNKATFLLPR